VALEYPWYGIVDGEVLEQGDFINQCPVFIPEYPSVPQHPTLAQETTEYEIHGEWQEYDVVVMSQTCDLVNSKLKVVIVCPHWSLNELGEHNPDFLLSKTQEEIRRGYRPGYHMLNLCDIEEKQHEIQVVDLLTVYSIPSSFIKQLAKAQGKRVRLLSPYKEHLSQAFARVFMRVGLPQDIPSFRGKK
jgi:hypothetical protein